MQLVFRGVPNAPTAQVLIHSTAPHTGGRVRLHSPAQAGASSGFCFLLFKQRGCRWSLHSGFVARGEEGVSVGPDAGAGSGWAGRD